MSKSKVTKATHGAGKYKDSDEKYTAAYVAAIILEFIPINITVWCPTDTEDSEFVKQLRARGNTVIASHIDNGQDFFDHEPSQEWDMIITNPPFTDKRFFFRRAISFGKPFMFLMSIDPLNDDTITEEFRNSGTQMQILHLAHRAIYMRHDGTEWTTISEKTGNENGSSFGSAYIGTGILPNDIVLRFIPRWRDARKARLKALVETIDHGGRK